MKVQDLVDYQNKWVAFTPDRKNIVASAKTIKVLVKKINKIPNSKDLILHFVLPLDKSYAF